MIKTLISFKRFLFLNITTYQFHHNLPEHAHRTQPSAVREAIVGSREFP